MVVLRKWRLADVDALAALATENVSKTLREMPDAERFIAEMMTSERVISRAVEVDGELAGCISLILDDELLVRSAEIGCWLGERFWRRGIATAAATEMCELGFRELGIEKIYAGVLEGNSAAAKVLEKIGFKFEGRLEEAVDKGGKLLDAFLFVKKVE